MPTKVTLVWSAGQRGTRPRVIVSMVLLLLFLLWSPLRPEDPFQEDLVVIALMFGSVFVSQIDQNKIGTPKFQI